MDTAPEVSTSTQPETPLGSYARAIRAHSGLVMVAILAALAASIAYVAVREPEYQASARLLIDPASSDDEVLLGLPVVRDAGDPTRTAQTAADLLHSPRAAEETARRAGAGWTTQSVLDAVTIEPAGQSNILAVTAVADSPAGAADLANDFADATLADRDAQLNAAVREEIRYSEPSAGAAAPRPAARDRVARLELLRSSGDPTVSLADRALAPRSASGTPWWLVVALALAAGAAVGAVAAVIVDARSPRRIGDEDELLGLMPEPVLARLPQGWNRFHAEPGMRYPTAADVAFRSLEVQLGLLDGRARAVMVSSPGPGDGKTTLLVSLALRLAHEGQPVVLMDLDLHDPGLADLVGVPAEPGLADALEPGGSLATALSPVSGIPGLEILPGMQDTRLAALAAARERLPGLIAEARARGSHVLIDTAPLGTVGDAVLLLDGVDELLIAARVSHTTVASVEATRDALRRAARAPSGLVIIGEELPAQPAPPRRRYAEAPRRREATDDDDRGRPSPPEPREVPLWQSAADPIAVAGDFAPGDRVIWTRGAASGLGTVQSRVPSAALNGGAPDGAEPEPRYLVLTDRSGKELVCRASALCRPLDARDPLVDVGEHRETDEEAKTGGG